MSRVGHAITAVGDADEFLDYVLWDVADGAPVAELLPYARDYAREIVGHARGWRQDWAA
jgi:hypothetical protein